VVHLEPEDTLLLMHYGSCGKPNTTWLSTRRLAACTRRVPA